MTAMQLPTLRTTRLTLRPMTPTDAPRLHELVSAREVAYNTLTIPHPYPEGAAAEWIAKHAAQAEAGEAIHLAIDDGQLCGVIGLMIRKESDAAEVGYWIGVPYWGRGYASEAVAEI